MRICVANSTQSTQQAFRVNRMNRRKVGCVERQLQGVCINVLLRIVEFHWRGALRLFQNRLNLSFPEAIVNGGRAVLRSSKGNSFPHL